MPLLLAAVLLAAGCRVMPGSSPSASPAGSSSPSTPSTPAMSPSEPTSAASGSPSATDSMAAFLERFTGDPPPYRVTLEVAIGGVSEGRALIEAEVNDADYRATVHVELAGLPPRDSEIVYVDGTGYLREGSDDQWVAVPGYRSTPPLNPFLVLQPADYFDEGTDPARGDLRHLSSSHWVEEDATLGFQEGGARDVRFNVWLDQAGVPLEATLEFELAGIDQRGEEVALTYSATYRFRDVGADINITPPVAPPTS